MTTFFIDLWHDLREKRLWPVAVGLLAAIVAVPAVLFKPESAPSLPADPAPHTGASALPVVSVAAGPTQGSRLEAFSQKNPFKPMKDLAKDTSPSGGSGSGGSGSGGSGSGGSTSGGSGSGGSTTGGSTSGGTGSGGTGGTGGTSPSSPSGPSVQWFHYVADFSFGVSGKRPKEYKSAPSLTLLPDEKNPSIVFLGVADDHKSAVFFISDPTFTAVGEGKCNASGAACRFVTLDLTESGDEENFSSIDGSVSYDVKLLDVKREDLSTAKSGAPKTAPKSVGKRAAVTGAGVAETMQASESILVPSLIASGPGVARELK
jgi:hypothetical protein